MDKPEALTTLQHVLPEAFQILKERFDVPDDYHLDLGSIDSVSEGALSSPMDVAAISMRKLQLLNIHSPLGVKTPIDTAMGLCSELVRSLFQLVTGRNGLLASERQTLVKTMEALETCAVIVGTMRRPGETDILE